MIYNKYLDSDIDEKMGSVLNTLRKVINIKNLVFVLIAILLSTKTFIGDFKPFNYVMLATDSAFEADFRQGRAAGTGHRERCVGDRYPSSLVLASLCRQTPVQGRNDAG